ncbi:MAG: hypothetical protein D6740_06245 [Alphaproteobacteria bacterium]|nr:MAG: hypothetical protein D6740_06245 [Alphaproteobacteria bacterium]
MQQNHQPPPDPDTGQTPDDLGARIAALKAAREGRGRMRLRAGRGGRMLGLQMALRLSADVASGFAVGGVIGYMIDQLARTTPLFLFIMLIFGGATGVREAIRSMRRIEAEMAASSPEEDRKD